MNIPQAIREGFPKSIFKLGGAIEFEDRLLGLHWDKFRSPEEHQRNKRFDFFNCTHQSTENGFEAQANRFLRLKLWPQSALDFFQGKNSLNVPYIVNGTFNLSTRFNSKLGGNQPGIGNWSYKAHDSVRRDGIVPESVWPTDPDAGSLEYYKDVTEKVRILGEESRSYFEWLYHKLDNDEGTLHKWLKLAPIQVGVGLCNDWHTGRPGYCGAKAIHQVLLERFGPDGVSIQDHYLPYSKVLPMNYPFPFVYQGVLYPVGKSPLPDGALLEDVDYRDAGSQVVKLRSALDRLGWSTGYGELYDLSLVSVVYDFKLSNLNDPLTFERFWSTYWNRGRKVDKAMRDVVNKMLRNVSK